MVNSDNVCYVSAVGQSVCTLGDVFFDTLDEFVERGTPANMAVAASLKCLHAKDVAGARFDVHALRNAINAASGGGALYTVMGLYYSGYFDRGVASDSAHLFTELLGALPEPTEQLFAHKVRLP